MQNNNIIIVIIISTVAYQLKLYITFVLHDIERFIYDFIVVFCQYLLRIIVIYLCNFFLFLFLKFFCVKNNYCLMARVKSVYSRYLYGMIVFCQNT